MELEVKVGIVAVNLVIWTGLFLYVLRLNRKVRELTVDERKDES